MSGLELVRTARQADEGIGVIFATGHSHVPEVSQIPSAIVRSKPFGEEKLAKAIRKCTARPLIAVRLFLRAISALLTSTRLNGGVFDPLRPGLVYLLGGAFSSQRMGRDPWDRS